MIMIAETKNRTVQLYMFRPYPINLNIKPFAHIVFKILGCSKVEI